MEALARDEGLTIKHYHSDNGIFLSSEFKGHCDARHIKYSFSGVGAKHQNGVAERNIKTAAQWACKNMLHLTNHWPQYASAKYWPQAINYAVWVFNNLPNKESGITPNELWSRSKSHDNILARAHVFGCPVYVLDTKLQDRKKIPKWAPQACLGLFLGFSELHSSQVPLVLNVVTGKISPQFHVIFNDKFETVHSLPLDKPLDQQWATIFHLGCEGFDDIDYDENNNPILPPLSDIIKTYQKEKVNQPLFEPIDAYNGNVYDCVDETINLHNDNDAGMHVPGGVFENASSEVVPVPGGATPENIVPAEGGQIMLLTMGFSTPVLAHAATSELTNRGQRRYENFQLMENPTISVSSLMPMPTPTNKPSIIHGKSYVKLCSLNATSCSKNGKRKNSVLLPIT